MSRERQIVDDLIDEFNREGTLHKSLQAHALKGPLPKQVRVGARGHGSALQCVALCCSVLQCLVVRCSVLQSVAKTRGANKCV